MAIQDLSSVVAKGYKAPNSCHALLALMRAIARHTCHFTVTVTVRSNDSALSGSTDTGLIKALLELLLFMVTQSIINILIEYILVWVEI